LNNVHTANSELLLNTYVYMEICIFTCKYMYSYSYVHYVGDTGLNNVHTTNSELLFNTYTYVYLHVNICIHIHIYMYII
jgi:hypothetical protein